MSKPFHNWPYDKTFAAIAAATSATSNISISVEIFAESFGDYPVAVPVEGLERYDYGYIGPDGFILPNKDGQYVRFDQVEAIIAAKDARIEELLATDLSKLEEFNCLKEQINELEANNEALTARVKELEKLCDHGEASTMTCAEECAALEKQLATTRKALEFYGDVHKYPAPLTGGMGDLWRDCGEIARNALTETFMPTHTHLKRGSSYSYFGTGTFQTDSWVYPHRYVDMGEDEEDMLSCDMQQVAVYLEADGTIWVRPVGEFNDGRFAKI